MLPHARTRVPAWADAWRRTGRLVLLLDFDGTLSPLVERAEDAAMLPEVREALAALRRAPGVSAAIVSGRGLADVRARAALEDVAYAGNHGMEIVAPGVDRVHPEAVAARPALDRAAARVRDGMDALPGVVLEDKTLSLTVHYRRAGDAAEPAVARLVEDAVADEDALRVTRGKMVMEIRPRVDWHKGRAVEFLLGEMRLPDGVPVVYLGDDTTDEDAFHALAASRLPLREGVLVADPLPETTAAASWVRNPHEVAELFSLLAKEMGAEG